MEVQEFKGRKDHADYIKRGIAVENYFVREAKKRDYNIWIASEEQNIKEHIDAPNHYLIIWLS